MAFANFGFRGGVKGSVKAINKLVNKTAKAEGKAIREAVEEGAEATTKGFKNAEEKFMEEGRKQFDKINFKEVNDITARRAAMNDPEFAKTVTKEEKKAQRGMERMINDRRERYARGYMDERFNDIKSESKAFEKKVEELGRKNAFEFEEVTDANGDVTKKKVDFGENLSKTQAYNRGMEKLNEMNDVRRGTWIKNNAGENIQDSLLNKGLGDKDALNKINIAHRVGVVKSYATAGAIGGVAVGAIGGSTVGRTEDDRKAAAVTGATVAAGVGAGSLGLLGLARSMARGGR